MTTPSFFSTFTIFVCFGLLASVPDLLPGQVNYPPETHAIPIPKPEDLPVADGPFTGSVASLKQFQCPDWFRDGKFGIWAHWGPQAVGRVGDWYARHMYEEGEWAYQTHIKEYGHPSQMGYKDIIPLWKAEKWDPDHLMELYKAAGAHYFVAQAVHHDNFDNWDSKYQKWNSVNMGPHKDMVGLWQQAALKQGLRFGVSEHLGHSFSFMQASHGADKKGPLTGVPYDGNNPAFWDLYQFPAAPGDTAWYANDPRWHQEWYARIHDLVTHYKPDLLYSDGGLPFGQLGMNIVAQLYNLSAGENGGKSQAVYTSKKYYAWTEFVDGIGVRDMERGGMTDIQPAPWQTDTSTGDWFYNRGDHYKTATSVIRTLVDIVSKNGNLLLNVVLRPDGSLPDEMKILLSEMAAWNTINSEAIYGTRPWIIYGEGPSTAKGVPWKEDYPFQATDIRFTRKGQDLYAIVLGQPTGKVVIRALSSDSPLVRGNPTQVTLLGDPDHPKWLRTNAGLIIQLPDVLPCKSALSFKIAGLTTVDKIDPEVAKNFKIRLSQQADQSGD